MAYIGTSQGSMASISSRVAVPAKSRQSLHCNHFCMNRLRTFGMSSSEYVIGLSCTVNGHVVGVLQQCVVGIW